MHREIILSGQNDHTSSPQNRTDYHRHPDHHFRSYWSQYSSGIIFSRSRWSTFVSHLTLTLSNISLSNESTIIITYIQFNITAPTQDVIMKVRHDPVSTNCRKICKKMVIFGIFLFGKNQYGAVTSEHLVSNTRQKNSGVFDLNLIGFLSF